MPELVRLAETVRGLVPPAVAVGRADPREVHTLLPGEALPGAAPVRLREFAAGRHAARAALRDLGLPLTPIPMAEDRSPLWPDGVAGSITHTRRACLAIAAPADALVGLGIDLEDDLPLAPDLWDIVLSPEDQRDLDAMPAAARGPAAMAVFSAKEAAYKAQYALSGTLFGFDTLRIHLDGDRFTAAFRRPVGPFAAGDTIAGRITRLDGHLLTLATIPA